MRRPIIDNDESDGISVVTVFDFKGASNHLLIRNVPDFVAICDVCIERRYAQEVRYTMSTIHFLSQIF